MCITDVTTMTTSSEDDGSTLRSQIAADNEFFKALLDLVPPAAYFSTDAKKLLLGYQPSDEEDEDEDSTKWKRKTHKKLKGAMNPLTTMSISQITEQQIKGQTIVPSKKQHKDAATAGTETLNGGQDGAGVSLPDAVDAKQKGKKNSRNAKVNRKNRGKELAKKEARLLELQERLRVKLEEMKARKNTGKPVTSQEQKRLRRQEKKVASKLKNSPGAAKSLKNEAEKGKRSGSLPDGLRSPPRNQILNQNGDPVKSKFDFSMFSTGNKADKPHGSNLHGKDYKRLLQKVEKKQEHVAEVKGKDEEQGRQLEQRLAWQATMGRARGEKVKDDLGMLHRAAKRKDKKKESSTKKWAERERNVQDGKEKRQQKRQANLDKRKTDKNDKKRKKLIKKGRVIPGF